MTRSSRWKPGRLIVGWALGVLTTIGLVTLMGGWYEYRQLSNAPGSGSPARRVASTDSACQGDRDGAINIGGFAVVPRQDDPCYLRRPRIRPWQWMDGIRDQIGRLHRRRERDTEPHQTARKWFLPPRPAEERIAALAWVSQPDSAPPATPLGRHGMVDRTSPARWPRM